MHVKQNYKDADNSNRAGFPLPISRFHQFFTNIETDDQKDLFDNIKLIILIILYNIKKRREEESLVGGELEWAIHRRVWREIEN